METIIPTPDPVGLPAPVWVLQVLLVLTFVLHLVAMNFLVGGVTMLGIGCAKAKDSPFHAKLAQVLGKGLPPTLAMTITIGVAPLLFLQVLYGQAFYTSSVLMAWGWLAIVPMVLIAYYGLYVVQFRPEWLGKGATWVSWLSAGLIFIIGMMFVSNSTLMLEPAKWAEIYVKDASGLNLNLSGNSVWARYAHFMVSGWAIGGLGLSLLAGRHEKSDPTWAAEAREYGYKWFLFATMANMLVGFWFLFSIPKPTRLLFLGDGDAQTAVLWLGVVAALAAMHFAKKSAWLGMGLITVTIVLMSVARQMLRDAMLAPHLKLAEQAVNPQWGVFALFAVLLLAGLGTVVWMLRKFAEA